MLDVQDGQHSWRLGAPAKQSMSATVYFTLIGERDPTGRSCLPDWIGAAETRVKS